MLICNLELTLKSEISSWGLFIEILNSNFRLNEETDSLVK